MTINKKPTKQGISQSSINSRISVDAARCRRKFLRFFPKGFRDEKYFAWERGYKWNAHEKWREQLNRAEYRSLLKKGEFSEIAARAVKIESPTNLIFSFEKMALRDAVRSAAGARIKGDLADLCPRDMIDVQSFIWVLGSEEYW